MGLRNIKVLYGGFFMSFYGIGNHSVMFQCHKKALRAGAHCGGEELNFV